MPPLEQEIRHNLAIAYRLLAMLGLDDLTYAHLSARIPGTPHFFIQPFGLLFEEVTADLLLKVTLDGQVIGDQESQYNKTGYVIHGSIYKHRPDLNAIFHLHTQAGVAVSALKCGLLPLSQWALHFYNRMAYHDYRSLALEQELHGQKLVQDLGENSIMILRNHGTLTCGRTIHEAFFYTHHLEQACKAQNTILSTQQDLIIPDEITCKQAVHDLLSFEQDLGKRDWDALIRKLEKTELNSYCLSPVETNVHVI